MIEYLRWNGIEAAGGWNPANSLRLVLDVVRTPESILAKYLFTSVVSLALTLAVYDLWIREHALTRFLFGMKPLPRREAPRAPPAAPRAAVRVPAPAGRAE